MMVERAAARSLRSAMLAMAECYGGSLGEMCEII